MQTRDRNPAEDQWVSIPKEYIRANYQPSDRLAVVILNREEGLILQRIATAQAIAGAKFQAWLRYKNAHGSDIYISQNTIREHAEGRTKADIGAIRHVYLDLDKDGDRAVAAIRESDKVPEPNFVIRTSPGKYQVIWKVEGMALPEAEATQRALVSQFGGDPAATDSSRVLRLPGFYNKKYAENYRVEAEAHSSRTYHSSDFKVAVDQAEAPAQVASQDQHNREQKQISRKQRSPSEDDWAWVVARLRAGEQPEKVIHKLAEQRQDKPNPQYYARLTVTRAYAAVALSRGDKPDQVVRTLSAYPPRPSDNGEQYARITIQQARERLERSSSLNQSGRVERADQAQQGTSRRAHSETQRTGQAHVSLRITP